MVLTAYVELSPVTGLFCHRHPRTNVLSAPGRVDTNIRKLDASVGASGPHDFAVRSNISRQRAVDRSQAEACPAIPLRAKRCRVHRIPHPTSVTIAKRPSVWDGMREVLDLIWGS
jgi:hypothetical protein